MRRLHCCCLPTLSLLFCLSHLLVQISAQTNASSLDNALQNYAFKAFNYPKTGVPYNASLLTNLTGIKIQSLRLKSGSLYKRGRLYNQFNIPPGVLVSPYVERLVFVYQNLGNFSEVYYPLKGYKYLAPVLGLLAYDGGNLSGQNLPFLDITASAGAILINFTELEFTQDSSYNLKLLKCVWFDLQGVVHFSNVSSKNVCSTVTQGHFSIVTEGKATRGTKIDYKTWIVIGSVIGGLVILVILLLVTLCVLKIRRRKKMQQMEKASEVGDSLGMIFVGSTRAPFAPRTRTSPMIENEYVP